MSIVRPLALILAAVPMALSAAPQAPQTAPSSQTALDRYVAAPDGSFAWKAVRELPAEGVTATLIEMTSQQWLEAEVCGRIGSRSFGRRR